MATDDTWGRLELARHRFEAVLSASLLYRMLLQISDGLSCRLDVVWELFRCSWIGRWLTAEPDPDVIVIDLRETRTVGPFILALDYVVDRLVAAVR